MERKEFLKYSTLISGAMLAGGTSTANYYTKPSKNKVGPLAITMWDFSWLERRWPGAGYENWDQALDELVERGYNAVRIDAYPHLIGENPTKEYTLLPVWNVQMWGSPDINKVTVQPNLNQFIAKCRERNIKVGLSSWYREDVDKVLMKIDGPEKMAENWIKTLDSIAKDGLLDSILYVDLCNEWPGDVWCPYFKNDPPEKSFGYWHTTKSMQFMKDSIELVRPAYPELPYCFSFTGGQPELYAERDLTYFNFIEHHIWMAQLNDGEYDKAVGYNYDRFSPVGYQNLVANYEKVYGERKKHWQQLLIDEIHLVAKSAKVANQPLITTECWGLVDFKDWPLLKWDVIKELCELAVNTAANTGQWIAMATSNFCGPQFVGMWRDIEWHQRMTKIIKNASISEELKSKNIVSRL